MHLSLKRLLYLCLPCGLLYGCISIAPSKYPSDWEKRATAISEIEARIAGDFSCTGEALRPSNHEVIEAGYLPADLQMDTKGACDTVRFRQLAKGTLEASVLKNGVVLEKTTFKAGSDYKADDGWLVFRFKEGGAESAGFAVIGALVTGSNSLTLDRSGNLIVRSRFTVAGLLVVVPVLGYGSTWARFERQSD